MPTDRVNESNDSTKKSDLPQKNDRIWKGLLIYFSMLLLFLWAWQSMKTLQVQTIAYSDFREYLASGDIVEATVSETEIRGILSATRKERQGRLPWSEPLLPESDSEPPPLTDKPAAEQQYVPAPLYFRTVRIDDPHLTEDLLAAKVKFVAERPSLLSQFLWAWFIPVLFLVFIWSLFFRRMRNVGTSVLSFAKSKAKLSSDADTKVTFADVAGCDEAKHELEEVVEFLKVPKHFEAVGAKIPKGVLLVGPPGTGKTLLARAVAGEAKVPFFSLSGSDFIEMFVGVGSARVRDLFEEAKKRAPCIVFIDEIDAIGRHRGVQMGVSNDEREQTLNQLLAQLDGFEPNLGVIVLAATNRPDVLDRALLRPGRFDRQVLVDAPDINGREAILKVHSRNKPLDDRIDFRRIAASTPGFSGADLANTLNEAALLAARRKATKITQSDLEQAIEKVIAGPERKSRRLGEEERRRVAYHEVGHALVATYCPNADSVHKISIVPRGRAALGYTLQLPTEDQYLLTREEILDKIRGLFGGRAAEELVFSEVSTGAENDLEKATNLAQQMVCLYGMGKRTGLLHVGRRNETGQYLFNEGFFERNCSEETARFVDEEVRRILDGAYADAREIIALHRYELERVAEELIVKETLDAAEFTRLLRSDSSAA